MNFLYASSHFLQWEEDFKKEYQIPLYYLNFSSQENPQVIFSTKYEGVSARTLPQCCEGWGRVHITLWIKTTPPNNNLKNQIYGVDILREKVFPFFRGRYGIISESINEKEIQIEQIENTKDINLVHEISFTLKSPFSLAKLER